MKIGPKYKICRRVGDRVFAKCETTKFTVSGIQPKQKGKKRRKPLSEYGSQLLEKQKARYTYGVSEKQFVNYVKKARQQSKVNPAAKIFQQLESRLDNAVYRSGLASTRGLARQIVSHGHIMVNGRKVTIPSYQIKADDVLSVRPQSRDKGVFTGLTEKLKDTTLPVWLSLGDKEEKIKVLALPEPKIKEDSTINYHSIIEFYSR